MLARRRIVVSIFASSLVCSFALVAHAQPALIGPVLSTPSPVEPGPVPPPPTAATKRAENAEQLQIAMRKLETNGSSDVAAEQEVAFYKTREAVLTQQDAVEQQIKDLESRKVELEAQLKSPVVENKQYTFADLDRMRDDLAAEQARANLVTDKLTTAKSNLDKAEKAYQENEVKNRQAQSAAELGKQAPNANELKIAAERASQNAALASETLTLRKRELEREQLAKQNLELGIRYREEQVARVSPLVSFTEADLQDQIASIKKSEESTTAALAQAQAYLHNTEADLTNTQKQLDAGLGDKNVLTEALAAHRRAKDKYFADIDSATQRLQQLVQLESAWKGRFEIANADKEHTNDETWSKLKTLQKETVAVLDQLATDQRTQIWKMRETRNALSSVTKKADAAAKESPELLYQIDTQKRRLEETLRNYEKNLVNIETSRRVHEKLRDEIGLTVEAITPQAIALGVWYQVTQVWNHELGTIGDKPILVGMTVKCLIILIVGWSLSKFTSGLFANRFLKRFRLSKDATSAIRSLVFYGMLIFVALSALDTINVPLTAFTIVGGALAIGVGFGSQTLINNFIGGLIMLAERPVRLGERITFKDVDGVVEDVGFRCTKLRTQSDHLVTIPNSTLVNESIENIDRRRTIRRTFTVAVTYNVSADLLADGVQAIRDILEEKDIRERIHPIVGFEELSPRVHFSDFGVESLNVQVSYWYAPVDSRAFAEHSERVNFRIMEELDNLGIDFAFPSKTPYVKNAKTDRGRRGDSYAA
jgi:small-conductance mechanosensitive channel